MKEKNKNHVNFQTHVLVLLQGDPVLLDRYLKVKQAAGEPVDTQPQDDEEDNEGVRAAKRARLLPETPYTSNEDTTLPGST